MGVRGYIRVSRVAGREGERFISPGEQRKAIEGWANLHGKHIDHIHEDLDQSGKKRHRPGLNEIMDAIQAGECDGVIVAKLDRFGRSVSHLGELLDILAANNAALYTVAEGIDTSGRAGRMIASIMSAVAEFEVDRQGESWLVARANAVERGVFVGGTVPLGYVKDDTGRLRPGPEAPLVKEAFERRAAGQSWATIADWLAERTTGKWSIGATRYLIRNRAYLGEIHAGQNIVNLNGHEPIVDRATFEAANAGKGVAPARNGRGSGLLSGIVRCASCRYALKPSMRVGGAIDYRCKTGRRENAARCPDPVSVSARKLDPYVTDRFFADLEASRAISTDSDAELEAAIGMLTEAESERDAALDSRLKDLIDTEAFYRLVQARQAAVEKAREHVALVKRRSAGLPSAELADIWPDLTLNQRRHLLASAFDCVFVRPGSDLATRVHFCELGSGVDLPTRGRRWNPKPFDFPV